MAKKLFKGLLYRVLVGTSGWFFGVSTRRPNALFKWVQVLQDHLQDLQDHLQDLQEHLQDLIQGVFNGFKDPKQAP